jgi:hypothetical protein
LAQELMLLRRLFPLVASLVLEEASKVLTKYGVAEALNSHSTTNSLFGVAAAVILFRGSFVSKKKQDKTLNLIITLYHDLKVAYLFFCCCCCCLSFK